MSQPDLSVVIPVYNRGAIIRPTLESVRRASRGLQVETIVVDDGSTPPTAEALAAIGFAPTRLVRQENRGLLFARLAGLAHVTGRATLFLDSDDLVGPEKFHRQLAAMRTAGADISYSDTARCQLGADGEASPPVADPPALQTTDGPEFCIAVQPAPHSPIFDTAWLKRIVDQAFFPPSTLYNCVAEIWLYHNAAPRPGRAVHVGGPHTVIGVHPGARLTNHWEKLGVASLAVTEAFARTCPPTPEAARARQFVAEAAFRAWRALPPDFPAEHQERLLAVWGRLGPGRLARLGGPAFPAPARLLGPVRAARWLRLRRRHPYASCRTLSSADYESLLRALPAP